MSFNRSEILNELIYQHVYLGVLQILMRFIPEYVCVALKNYNGLKLYPN